MSFNSFAFLIFAPCALLGHVVLRGRALRIWLVVMSYVFYGWAIPWYCLLLFASTVLDFFVALRLSGSDSRRRKRAWLLVSLCGNLGLLAAFKYLGFFARSLNGLAAALHLDLSLSPPELLLPVGISFYTFQTIGYTIDVYRGRLEPTRSFTAFALYVAFFPQLVAGPIERAGHLLQQLVEKQPQTDEDVLAGTSRILWGLVKKIVFADWLAVFVNQVYGDPARASGWDLALATYAFAFQIYLDFSAYSDIAIGLARVMGIRLMENFRWPYLSRNISEFWRRWHISLSTWLRDYLYVALGGSRKGTPRTVLNVLIVMFLGGLWHGADEKFIVWGLWLGLALGIYHWFAAHRPTATEPETPFRLSDLPAIFMTFHVVLLSWIFFRASSLSDALYVLGRFTHAWGDFTQPPDDIIRTAVLITVAALAHLAGAIGLTHRLFTARSPAFAGAFWGMATALITASFAPVGERFIYFQF